MVMELPPAGARTFSSHFCFSSPLFKFSFVHWGAWLVVHILSTAMGHESVTIAGKQEGTVTGLPLTAPLLGTALVGGLTSSQTPRPTSHAAEEPCSYPSFPNLSKPCFGSPSTGPSQDHHSSLLYNFHTNWVSLKQVQQDQQFWHIKSV
jgi:hypothetical protein